MRSLGIWVLSMKKFLFSALSSFLLKPYKCCIHMPPEITTQELHKWTVRVHGAEDMVQKSNETITNQCKELTTLLGAKGDVSAGALPQCELTALLACKGVAAAAACEHWGARSCSRPLTWTRIASSYFEKNCFIFFVCARNNNLGTII